MIKDVWKPTPEEEMMLLQDIQEERYKEDKEKNFKDSWEDAYNGV